MNSKKAKALRKEVYGDKDYRDRKYYKHPNSGMIMADSYRQKYQNRKKELC